MIRAALMAVALSAAPAAAQVATSNGTGVILRGLDKVTGRVTDVQIAVGGAERLGRLTIGVRECRYPKGNRSGDAFAFLTVREVGHEGDVFEGWMIASSPALNAMDHARYDVWVLRCTTS
ncbi:DUF2155 domain-containing protein [Pseudaestuariivita atlantica]|uniref:DUF2155 domain-containing protein n=1 Tax=Pseudaestuariivita atlantica TaxID=1317121 RepID=A0A0L1JLK1_9RHOB|nr:DUF2155 domain-containing protein [Pseudaestuariivita atlantica]KNG92629.1 hypothetical protein ATO11_16550 [Pseudaestuariivita atlantica]